MNWEPEPKPWDKIQLNLTPPEPSIDLSGDLEFHRTGVEAFKKWLEPMLWR